MFYTIYKITNTINGKYYIGMHQTKNLNDGYFGSGKRLKCSIEKYGKDNFTKEILFIFDNEADMKAKEAELVTINEQTYNLCDGGKGGWGYINRTRLNTVGIRDYGKIAEKVKITKSTKEYFVSAETKHKMKENHWSVKNPIAHKIHLSKIHKNKQVSENTKQKLSDAFKNKKKPIVECPYCHKHGSIVIMNRWHMEKCKERV